MRSNTTTSAVVGTRPFFGRRASAFSSGGRRLLAAAAVLHIALAFGLHCAGRAQVAPGLVDRDGIMGSFAFDSYEYQRGAVRLAEVLRRDGAAAWASAREPVHVRLISIQFALLGPLSGYGTLSAEPFNLLCYLAVVGLTLLLGREVGGRRAGLFAAGAVALWPTFLLHTLQLLKDPLFMAGTLALVLCVTTWLTRTYGRASAAGALAFMGVTTLLILLIRFNFVVVVFALVLAGTALLVVRQIVERRLLYWNMAAPALILASGALLLPLLLLFSPPAVQRLKHYPSDGGGEPKTAVNRGEQVATAVTYLTRAAGEGAKSRRAGGLRGAGDRLARRVGGIRYRFSAFYSEAGSGIDRDARFGDFGSLLLYLPRAFQIGWWAPFPNTWVGTGKRVGSAGKLLSGAETLFMYLVQLLALAAVIRPPRRLAAWLLFAVTVFGVTALGLVVPNIGALYRFRYPFWVLLIVLGAKGFESLLALRGREPRARGVAHAAACGVLACLLATAVACSTDSGPSEAASPTQGSGALTNAAPADGSAEGLGFTLVNETGTDLRTVYVSPSDSGGWEENVLGGGGRLLADGESVKIRFSPDEKAGTWDIKIVGVDDRFAEWKGLRLGGASTITLHIDMGERMVVVAEVE